MFWLEYMAWEENHHSPPFLISMKTSRSEFRGPRKYNPRRGIWRPPALAQVGCALGTLAKCKQILGAAHCLGHRAPAKPRLHLTGARDTPDGGATTGIIGTLSTHHGSH